MRSLVCYQSTFVSADMYAFLNHVKRRLILLLILQIYTSLSISVNFRRNKVPNIVAKTKLPLKPVDVSCHLSHMIRITAPIVNEHDQHYMTRPNGDTFKLDIKTSNHLISKKITYSKIIVTNFFGNTTVIIDEDNYNLIQVCNYEKELATLAPNEFIIGPLLEEDHGNWVLSVYNKDINGDWIELFQVFTMSIIEFVELVPRNPKLVVGDTFNLSFSMPYQSLESCEIQAPSSTYDRFFNRSFLDFNKCGFTIPNITTDDEGFWTIIGIGRIIYKGEVALTVIKPKSLKKTKSTINNWIKRQ